MADPLVSTSLILLIPDVMVHFPFLFPTLVPQNLKTRPFVTVVEHLPIVGTHLLHLSFIPGQEMENVLAAANKRKNGPAAACEFTMAVQRWDVCSSSNVWLIGLSDLWRYSLSNSSLSHRSSLTSANGGGMRLCHRT